MVDMAFFRGGLGRWLPPSVPPVDEAVLLRRCWELLVLDRPGTARLAVLGRAPLCRTVLLPQENTAAPLRAQQVVGCGLSPRCSLTRCAQAEAYAQQAVAGGEAAAGEQLMQIYLADAGLLGQRGLGEAGGGIEPLQRQL